MTSSDGVPLELAVLGFQRSPARTGLTGRRHRSDRPAQSFVGVDRSDDRSRVLVHSSVFGAILFQHLAIDGKTIEQDDSPTIFDEDPLEKGVAIHADEGELFVTRHILNTALILEDD